jgi:hypothetical protein
MGETTVYTMRAQELELPGPAGEHRLNLHFGTRLISSLENLAFQTTVADYHFQFEGKSRQRCL